MTNLTRSLVRHSHAIAFEVGARAVLLYADVIEEDEELRESIQHLDFPAILVSRRHEFRPPEGLVNCSAITVPNVRLSRMGQIKIATLICVAKGLVRRGDRVVCLSGIDGSDTIDTMVVLDMASEVEALASAELSPLGGDIQSEVFERVLMLASELAVEGREGRPVGTVFVMGDSDAVLDASRQLVINPFHGYAESERNVLDPHLEETIKEFSAIDGAYVIRGDGVILAAGRYLIPHDRGEPLPQGLGTRHEAAAAITAVTRALALAISESTGTVTIFKSGRLVTDIPKPRSRSVDSL